MTELTTDVAISFVDKVIDFYNDCTSKSGMSSEDTFIYCVAGTLSHLPDDVLSAVVDTLWSKPVFRSIMVDALYRNFHGLSKPSTVCQVVRKAMMSIQNDSEKRQALSILAAAAHTADFVSALNYLPEDLTVYAAILPGLANNKNVPGNYVANVFHKVEGLASRCTICDLAIRPDIPADTLRAIANRFVTRTSCDLAVANSLARNPATPKDLLKRLYSYARKHKERLLHYFLASNPNTPPNILKRYIRYRDASIRRAALQNPNLPVGAKPTNLQYRGAAS